MQIQPCCLIWKIINSFLFSLFLPKGFNPVKEGQQARQVDVLLQRAGKQGEPPVQIRDFLRGQQAEMAAFDLRLRDLRQTAEHRKARLLLEHRGKRPAKRGSALVEDHARDMAVRLEVPHRAYQAPGVQGTAEQGNDWAWRASLIPRLTVGFLIHQEGLPGSSLHLGQVGRALGRTGR